MDDIANWPTWLQIAVSVAFAYGIGALLRGAWPTSIPDRVLVWLPTGLAFLIAWLLYDLPAWADKPADAYDVAQVTFWCLCLTARMNVYILGRAIDTLFEGFTTSGEVRPGWLSTKLENDGIEITITKKDRVS